MSGSTDRDAYPHAGRLYRACGYAGTLISNGFCNRFACNKKVRRTFCQVRRTLSFAR